MSTHQPEIDEQWLQSPSLTAAAAASALQSHDPAQQKHTDEHKEA